MTQPSERITRAIEQIEQETANLLQQQIIDAARKGDLNAVTLLSKRASELESIRSRLVSLNGGSRGPVATAQGPRGLRVLEVVVTDGALRQNLLTLSDPVKAGRISVGEALHVEALPSGDRFDTELLPAGNKLRARGAIAKFYRDAGVLAGDVVELVEVAPGHWQLKKKT